MPSVSPFMSASMTQKVGTSVKRRTSTTVSSSSPQAFLVLGFQSQERVFVVDEWSPCLTIPATRDDPLAGRVSVFPVSLSLTRRRRQGSGDRVSDLIFCRSRIRCIHSLTNTAVCPARLSSRGDQRGRGSADLPLVARHRQQEREVAARPAHMPSDVVVFALPSLFLFVPPSLPSVRHPHPLVIIMTNSGTATIPVLLLYM